MRTSWIVVLPALWTAPTAAADFVELRLLVPPNGTGSTTLVIDRDRVSSIVVNQGEGPNFQLQITLDPEAKPRFVLRCRDLPTTTAAVAALTSRSNGLVDLTGRCQL
jgi:hypothetical protein